MKNLSAVTEAKDIATKEYVDAEITEVDAKAERMIISSSQISTTQPSGQVANDVWLEVLN